MIINPNGYYESYNGLLLPKSSRKKTVFDFFAGCGGFSLGFMKAGFEVVGMNEIAMDAVLTYCVNLSKQPMSLYWDTPERGKELNEFLKKAMFPKSSKNKYFKHCSDKYYHESDSLEFPVLPGTGWILTEEIAGNIYPPVKNIFVADIRNLTGDIILERIKMKRGELDCVMGGPPCQGYSKAGKQDINDPRNELIFHFARLIVELNPKTFIMEEVPNIVNFRTPRGTYVLEEFGQILDEGGFMEYSMFCDAMKFIPKSKTFVKVKKPESAGKIENQMTKRNPVKRKQLEIF